MSLKIDDVKKVMEVFESDFGKAMVKHWDKNFIEESNQLNENKDKHETKTREQLEQEFKELELDFKFLIDIYNKEEAEKECYCALSYKLKELFYNVLKRVPK